MSGSRGPLSKAPKASLKFTPGVPPAPSWLSAAAKTHYKWLVDEYSRVEGHLQMPDMGLLAMASAAYADMVKQQKVCDNRSKQPVVLASPKGGCYINPEHTFLTSLRNQYKELMAKLGGSPADRQRINTQAEAAGLTDPLADYFKRRGGRQIPPPAPAKKKTTVKKAVTKKTAKKTIGKRKK